MLMIAKMAFVVTWLWLKLLGSMAVNVNDFLRTGGRLSLSRV